MENLKLLNELGVNPDVISNYQILCLPENFKNQSEKSGLVDTGDAVHLSKLLKEEGVKCANSYDIHLHAKIIERRGVDLWFGSIWILDHAALPILISVVGRLLGEEVQKKIEISKQIKASQKAKEFNKTSVHADLRVADGEVSAEIKFDGDADTFLKVLRGINNGQQPSE